MRRLVNVIAGRATPRLFHTRPGPLGPLFRGTTVSQPLHDLPLSAGLLSKPARGITLPATASNRQVHALGTASRAFSSIPHTDEGVDAASSATGSYVLRPELVEAFAEGGPDAAAVIFDSIPPEDRTISEWMSMISRSARDHRPALALRYLNLFLVNYSGLPPVVVDTYASFGFQDDDSASDFDVIDAYRFFPSTKSPFFPNERHQAVARARADRRDALPSSDDGGGFGLSSLIRYASLSPAPIPRVLPTANAMRAVVESLVHVASLARDGATIVGAFTDTGADAGAAHLAFPCNNAPVSADTRAGMGAGMGASDASMLPTETHPSWPVTVTPHARHMQMAASSLLLMRTAAQLGLPMAAENISPLLRRLSRLLPSEALPDVVDTMDIVTVAPAAAPAFAGLPPPAPAPAEAAAAAAATARGAWALAVVSWLRAPGAEYLGTLASAAPPRALRLDRSLERARPAVLSEAVAAAVLRATALTTDAARMGTRFAGTNALAQVENVRAVAHRAGAGSIELEIQYARALQLAGQPLEAWRQLAETLLAPEAAEGDPSVLGAAYSVLMQSLSLMTSLSIEQRVAVAATVFRVLQARPGVESPLPAPAAAVDHLVFLTTRTRDWALITDILAALICQTPVRSTISAALLPHPPAGAQGADLFDWSVALGNEGDALAAIVEVIPNADWHAALQGRAPALKQYQTALSSVADPEVLSFLHDITKQGGPLTAAAADPASDLVFLCPLDQSASENSEELSTAVAAASANPLSRGGFKFSSFFGPHTLSNVLDTFSSVTRPNPKRSPVAVPGRDSRRNGGPGGAGAGAGARAGAGAAEEVIHPVMASDLINFPPDLTRAKAVSSIYSLATAMDVLLSPRMTRALIQALIATTPDPKAALRVITDLLRSAAGAGVVMDRSFAPLLLSFGFSVDTAAGLQVVQSLTDMGIPITSEAIKTVLQAASRAGESRAVHSFFPLLYDAIPASIRKQPQPCDAVPAVFAPAFANLRSGPAAVPAAAADMVVQDKDLLEAVFLATQLAQRATASRLDAEMALRCVDLLTTTGRGSKAAFGEDRGDRGDPLAALIAALTLRVPFDLANAAEQVASMSPPVQGWAIMRRLSAAKDMLAPGVDIPYAPALSLSRLVGTAMTLYNVLEALSVPGRLDPTTAAAVKRAIVVAEDASMYHGATAAAAGIHPGPRKAFASSMSSLFAPPAAVAAAIPIAGGHGGLGFGGGAGAGVGAGAGAGVAAVSPFSLPSSLLSNQYRRLKRIRSMIGGEVRHGQALGRSRKVMLPTPMWVSTAIEVEELVRPLAGIDRVDWHLIPRNMWEHACGAIPSSRPPDAMPRFVPFRGEGAGESEVA